jgi:DNA polymerase elongation subunit (family B)
VERLRGWLLDAYVQGSRAVLWVKGEDGSMLRLTDGYTPFFHVEAREGVDEDDLLYRLSDCREVRSARAETRLTSLEHGRPRRLVRVEAHGTEGFRDLVASIERNACVSRVYNAGMRHVQRYLFTRLPIEPSSRVLVSHEGERLMGMERLDDWNELAPPPFSLFYFSPLYSPSEDGAMAVTGVATRFRGERREFASMGGFAEYLREADPDLLSCPKCDRVAYPALRAAFSEGGAPFDLGRCADRDQVRAQGSLAGRVILGDIFYGFDSDEWGIAGLVERTRFSFAPMGLSTRWLSNKSIDSRNCYVLLQRGYAIPKEEFFEEARPLRALSERDRGGITITPEAGRLHKNVAALDFDSQYPNIILRNNLSYESPSGGAGGLGVLPTVVGPWLERWLHLKNVKRTLAAGTAKRLYCEQRVDALKMVLVTIYGISGCCRNRFGNVVAFEEINKRSRGCMLKAKAVAESRGFHIVYSNVDSLFLSREGASGTDYEALAAEIAAGTGMPMSLDKHFRFMAFLPLKRDPSSSALNHYFGLTYDGKVEARGIELRRSDTPEFVRSFQERLIRSVLDHANVEDVLTEGVGRGMELLRSATERVRRGDVHPEELVIRRRLGKAVGAYTASVAQRSAALQLLHAGKGLEVGDDVPFIYTDHGNPNPLCRVRAPELFSGSYDREMYVRLLEEAASTVWRGMGAHPAGDASSTPTLERWIGRA